MPADTLQEHRITTVLTEDGETHYLIMHDTICVPNCPHDIVSPGRLCWAGCSFVLGARLERSYMRLPNGTCVTVINRGILFIPKARLHRRCH